MSIWKDGLHQFLLHGAQGHTWKMLRVEPGVGCYLQQSISLVIRNVGAQPPCHELSKRPGKVGGATHAFGMPAAPLTDEEILFWHTPYYDEIQAEKKRREEILRTDRDLRNG
jgi:hypothetical protein